MDSGSSGSIQSSSGGDEEYDDGGFCGGFLNNPPGHVGPMAKPNPPSRVPPATHLHPHSSSSLFDPFSNFFDPLPPRSHQNSLLNLHNSWPTSHHEPIQLPGSIPSSTTTTTTTTTTNTQLQSPTTKGNLSLTTDRSDLVHNINSNASVRNPRKRTRASRRAPTTVLTTDTSNFRAMVQEFTGIPSPPFNPASSSSSSFPRARLELFGGTPSPPYLLRPFPQKLSAATNSSLLSPSSEFLLPKHNHHLSSMFNLQPPLPLPLPLPQPNINLLPTTTDPLPQHLPSPNVTDGAPSGLPPTSAQPLFRSIHGKYSTATKLNANYSASSSDFHRDQASDNVTTRTEAIIESWICSSD